MVWFRFVAFVFISDFFIECLFIYIIIITIIDYSWRHISREPKALAETQVRNDVRYVVDAVRSSHKKTFSTSE